MRYLCCKYLNSMLDIVGECLLYFQSLYTTSGSCNFWNADCQISRSLYAIVMVIQYGIDHPPSHSTVN